LFYNVAGRWEGEGYSCHIDNKGPDKVAVTVSYSGQIPEGALESAGVGGKEPINIKIERTMTLLPGSAASRST